MNASDASPSKRILVVNDESCQLTYTSQVLRNAGHTVCSFNNANLALEGLRRTGPVDLIVTDLNMPGMSGWSFCEALRSPSYREHNATPILVISATFTGLESHRICQELGVNDFLALPYTTEQLRRKTDSILAGCRPKAGLTALLWGFDSASAQEQAFSDFGYEVVVCHSYEEAMRAKDTREIHVAVALGDLDPEQSTDFFIFEYPMVARLWIQPNISNNMTARLGKLGVEFVTFDQPERVVGLCEKARQRGPLTHARNLLEERTLQLQSSEAIYRTLFHSIPDLVVLTDETGNILNVNEAGCTMLGRPAERIIGQRLSEFIQEELKEQVEELLRETINSGYVQYEMVFHGATEMTMEIHQRKLLQDGLINILAIARDVSERHQYQEAVRLTDLRYRILAENTYDWEFWTSPLGHFLFSSPACEKVTGYPPLDFEDDVQVLFDMIHPDDRPYFSEQWPVEASEEGRDFVFRIYRADGELRWINHVSLPIYDNYGNFIGSRGSHRDITEKRKSEEERARLVSAVEQMTEAIVITDVEGNIGYANQSYLDANGLSLDDVMGHPPELVGADNGPAVQEEIRDRLRESRNWSGSYLKRNSQTQDIMHMEATVSLVRDAHGKPSHYIWVERNVTHERHLQEQLLHSQKLETVGRLAGGIAHDFNNLLGGILGHTALLKMHSTNSGEILNAAETIERTARRAADLTQKLLGFARQGKHQNVALSLHKCIQDCLELLRGTLDERIQIVTDFCSENPTIMGDPTQLEQILLNLSINARDAMEHGGILTFRTRIVDQDEETASERGLPAGRFAHLEVSDNGPGIPLELQSRIFEPFFTTKDSSKGTGMGLAMVYGIVHNHGGAIQVESQPGSGATFVVSLPLVIDKRPKKAASKPSPLPRGSGKVLVVDDEDLLRDVASRLLKHLGYEVATAADGIEACDYYESNYKEVDLVIIDMMMPRMAGPECFRKLKLCNPDVRAILSTGYSLNETAQALLDEGMMGFVQKPYMLSQLSEAVSRALVGRTN